MSNSNENTTDENKDTNVQEDNEENTNSTPEKIEKQSKIFADATPTTGDAIIIVAVILVVAVIVFIILSKKGKKNSKKNNRYKK